MILTCFEGVSANPLFWFVAGLSAIAAFVLLWMVKFQSFQGKPYYALTFIAMIWTLLMVGSEAASRSYACQMHWATFAWLGHALLPVSWSYFVCAYVDNAAWIKTRRASAALVIMPLAGFALALTNPWHHLMYTEATSILPGEKNITFDHGAGFYAIIGLLYVFVMITLVCLAKAFGRAKRAAWPLLIVLVVITVTPLSANIAYIVLDFTVFGLDPTAFMFAVGIFAFTWLLVTNKTMDMASVGKSILFNTMSEPVVLIDRHKTVVKNNTAAKRSGLLTDGGRHVADLFASITGPDATDKRSPLSLGGHVYEPRIQKIENPIDPAGAVLGWSVTFVDITERIAITSALEEALKKADDASRAKDDFVSVVSHELRTPLTSLKGGLTLALSGHLGEVPAAVRAPLEIANRNGVRLSRLVDDILLAQKIDSQALSLDEKPVDLGTLLAESFEENKMFAVERGVNLAHEKPDQPVMMTGDAFAVRQIIDNLISNAIKFSDQDSTVEGALILIDGCARLAIKDSGRGIGAGMEDQVFGRFGQVKDGGQHATQGSGLGLHISKQLAQQMSGDLCYESQVDVGTTFYVEFPLSAHQGGDMLPAAS